MANKNFDGMEQPSWYDGKTIDEVAFCASFLRQHPMKCIRWRLFTVDGLIEDEGKIQQMILDEVMSCQSIGIAKKVKSLFDTLKLMAYSEPLPIETDRIHVANGTYFLNGTFTEDKTYCNNRMKVKYNPSAPQPQRWLRFLSDLLVLEDIPTLQEYLGYCLIPSTKGQKMLMLIGKGGEGKSRIGLVMRSILGDSMNTTSIQKIENNRFSRADLENKLLMVDDDMDMSALPKTNYIKSIVTAECKMDLERKGIQSYQSQLYARFLCFGNGALTALHDQSDGFFRRQIVLTTKDRPADRTRTLSFRAMMCALLPSMTEWTANVVTARAWLQFVIYLTNGIPVTPARKSVSVCISVAQAVNTWASRPTDTAVTRRTRSIGFWMKKQLPWSR